MRLASYHLHTTHCDGTVSAAAMLDAARKAGMTDLGFSAHAAWPFAASWHLPPKRYDAYLAEVRALARGDTGGIRVWCGFEADYLPGATVPDRGYYAAFSPDFLIGSVHYVASDDPGRAAEPWTVDGPAADVRATLERAFDGDGKRAVSRYFALLREMTARYGFDIIGHADLPRKRNGELGFFDENAPWYRKELEVTADAIGKSGKIVEINTGAITRGAMDDLYPSGEFLAILARQGARFTLNSDAHAPEDLTGAYDRAYRAAREAGVRELWFLGTAGWEPEALG